jgi:hypothetical protein
MFQNVFYKAIFIYHSRRLTKKVEINRNNIKPAEDVLVNDIFQMQIIRMENLCERTPSGN